MRPRPLPALALALLVALPWAGATAPGSFSSQPGGPCPEPPCLRWMASFQGTQGASRAHAVAFSPDGMTLYAVGAQRVGASSTDLFTLAISVRTGGLLWSASYDGPAHSDEGDVSASGLRHVAVSPDGGTVVVAANSQGPFGFRRDVVTVAYDAATGIERWARRFNGPDSKEDAAAGVVVDGAGHVVTVGTVEDGGGFGSWAVLGYDLATGTPLWTRIFSNPCNQERAFGVALLPTPLLPGGAAVVGGLSTACLEVPAALPGGPTHASAQFQMAAAALDPATGDVLWRTAAGDPLAPGASAALGGHLAAAGGRVFVVGGLTHPTNPATDLDGFVLAADAAGSVLWTGREDWGARDVPVGAVATPDRLFLVLSSAGLPTGGVADQNPDLVAAARAAADGTPAWRSRIDSSATPAVPAAPDGSQPLGTGVDVAAALRPALFAGGLAVAYSAQEQPLLGQVGSFGTPEHRIAILDADTGAVGWQRAEGDLWGDVLAARPGAAAFVAAGWQPPASSASAVVRQFSLDLDPPVIEAPAEVFLAATSAQGAPAAFDVRAVDGREGALAASCAPAPGGLLPLGASTVLCQASDSSGNTATAAFPARVAYSWSGLEGASDGERLRRRFVDLSFRLEGPSAGVADAAATLWVAPAGAFGLEGDAAAVPARGGGNAFQFEDGAYRFRWDTASVPRGAHQLRVDLGDGVARTVQVQVA